MIYDMIIIGGGPGGYTAALYAARAGLTVAVVERLSPGGQMALTHQIDNYPGFPEGIDGFELGSRMQQQAERFGAVTLYGQVERLELTEKIKAVHTASGTHLARTVVYAAGAGPKYLGIPEEEAFAGRGVAYCAACDGMFYRGKTVAVVGGGNSAVADALLLSRVAKQVILIHRRDSLRASRVYHKSLEEAANISILWDSQVTGLLGQEKLSGVRVRNRLTGEETVLPCEGLFVSIGRTPATELLQGQVELDSQGYVLADETTKTNLAGVFAVGDVRVKPLRQIVTAVADGAMAVHMAEEYLAQQ